MADKEKPRHVNAAVNRRARYNYEIGQTFEAGIALTGTEVKSLRGGGVNLGEAYASAENGGIFLINCYIPEYKLAGQFFQHSTRRPRQLLLKKKEIAKLAIATEREGMTIIPLEIYFNAKGRAKLRIGIAKGKKNYDKRESKAKQDWNRQKARLMRGKG